MTAISEIDEAEIWLYQTLTADPVVTATFGTNIGHNPLARGGGYPRLTYNSFTAQEDLRLVGSEIFYAKLRFVVRAIVEGTNTFAIKDALAAMHAAIDSKYGFTDSAYIVSCTRVRPYYLHEMSDSLEYTHQGGEYLIRIRPKN